MPTWSRPFSPRSVSRPLRIKSPFFQICPERINVGYVENHPPPASRRTTLLQIEDGRLRILRAERREPRAFSAVEKIEPDARIEDRSGCQAGTQKCGQGG